MTLATPRHRGRHRHSFFHSKSTPRGFRYAHERQDLPITEIAYQARMDSGGLDPAGSPPSGQPDLDVEAYPSWRLMVYGFMIFVGVTLICTAVAASALLAFLPWG